MSIILCQLAAAKGDCNNNRKWSFSTTVQSKGTAWPAGTYCTESLNQEDMWFDGRWGRRDFLILQCEVKNVLYCILRWISWCIINHFNHFWWNPQLSLWCLMHILATVFVSLWITTFYRALCQDQIRSNPWFNLDYEWEC